MRRGSCCGIRVFLVHVRFFPPEMKASEDTMRVRFSILLGLFLVGSLTLAGCSQKQRATVKGKISFMKQPLTAGTVAFVTADGRTGSGIIKANGEYLVSDAPVGETTITVTTPKAPMGPMPNMPQAPPGNKGMPKEMMPAGYEEGKAVRIVSAPESYAKTETSKLKYTVKPGAQDYDIELTP